MKNTTGKHTIFSKIIKTLYVVSFAFIIYFIISGFSFYITGYQARPQLEAYRTLRPAGDFGHGVGIIGSAMMLFMLLYSLRKRTRFFGKLGKLSHWLDVHIYFGIIGPLLVILHSSFKVQGLVAVSFWAMLAVALSGVFGRYLYLQIPRDVDDDNLSLKEIEDSKGVLDKQLKDGFNIQADVITAVGDALAIRLTHETGILRSFIIIMFDDLIQPFKAGRLKKNLVRAYNIDHATVDRLYGTLRRKHLLERKILLFDQIQQLFHYWHVFHKPFAIIMYLIMLVHIGIAVWLGYTWKF